MTLFFKLLLLKESYMEEVSDASQDKRFKFIHIIIHPELPNVAGCFVNSCVTDDEKER